MPFETNKNRIRDLQKDVDLSFFKPIPVLKKYGFTQIRLAEALNLSQATVNHIINGNPNIAQVKMIADVIGCNFMEFFDLPALGAPEPVSSLSSCPVCNSPLTVTLSCPAKNQQ